MIFVTVPRPHGYLLLKGKKTALASDKALPAGQPVIIACDGELYGEAVLSAPVAVNAAEFERLQAEHCTSPAERALYWPGVEAFYIHRLKEWRPYAEPKPAETLEPGEAEQALLERAESLPKTIILDDMAVALSGRGSTIRPVVTSEVEPERIKAMIRAGLGEISLDPGRHVPLYQLALVRLPRLGLKAGDIAGPKKKDSGEQAGGKSAAEANETDGEEQEGGDMPYKIDKEMDGCDGMAVVKSDTGEMVKCHETMEEAMAHMAALRLNVEAEEDKEETGESKAAEAPVEGDKETWSAAAVNDLPDGSFLYIEPGGEKDDEGKTKPRSLRHFPYKDADGQIDLPHLRNAIARIPQADLSPELRDRLQKKAQTLLTRENEGKAAEVESGEKVGQRLRRSWKDKIRGMYETLKELMSWAEYEDEEPEEMPMMEMPMMEMFSKGIAVKEIGGRPWFFAHATNAFKDREQEIFSTKALERYVVEAEEMGSRGFFNFWHIPGSDFARKEWQGVIGRVLVEAGPFLDDAKGRAALAFFQEHPRGHPDIAPEGWGCSPEYRYLPEERKSGVYSWIWITRTSALPRAAAANIHTKGGIMALTDQQRKAAEALFGTELAAQIIAGAEAQTKELEEAGIAHKEAEPPTAEETTPEQAEETPAPVEETPPAGPDVNGIVEEVLARLQAQEKPKAMDPETLTNVLATIAGKMDELAEQVKQIETAGKAKQQVEMPRWFSQQIERASQAQQTVAGEGDELTKQKPQETAPAKDASGASHFFPARK